MKLGVFTACEMLSVTLHFIYATFLLSQQLLN